MGGETEILTSFNTYGEITRSFVFAPEVGLFLLPQTNYLDPSLNVSLWRIGVNGSTSQVGLSPSTPTGLVTGFCWTSSKVYLATYNADKTGYIFYIVDPVTGFSVVSATAHFGANDSWAGW
jgi:hypothetical protein